MQDVSSEALLIALALMLLLLPWANRRPTLNRRLIAGLSCVAVVALAISNLFADAPLLLPITESGKMVIAGGASVLFFAAVAWNVKRGLFAVRRQEVVE